MKLMIKTAAKAMQKPAWLGAIVGVMLLTGCASESRVKVVNLDQRHQMYKTEGCQQAITNAKVYDDMKLARIVASPVAILLSGGSLLLPVLATNAGLETLDHMEASSISVSCGGPETSTEDMAMEVLKGAAIGLTTSTLNVGGAAGAASK
ncbi:MAG: hypothetical protein RL697_1161 [Pseudomonadota bacterium]|jgi:hypothetical protein